MYRAVTMWVTALPKADKNYECAEKFDGPLTFAELFKRVVKIVTGKGPSLIQEKASGCSLGVVDIITKVAF